MQDPLAADAAPVLVFSGTEILIPSTDAIHPWFAEGTLPENLAPLARPFEFEGKAWGAALIGAPPAGYLPIAGHVPDSLPGAVRIPVRESLARFGGADARLVLKAYALANWDAATRFCAACGAALGPGPGTGEAAGGKLCGSCGRAHFPRISPAVIVRITKGDRILLAHNAKFPAGRYGLIAGFVEAGETVEETVRREVREEAGLEVTEVRYLRSQPWPFPDSLMLAFEAKWKSGEARPDGEEITELRWCGVDDLPDLPPPGSVAYSLISEFLSENAIS